MSAIQKVKSFASAPLDEKLVKIARQIKQPFIAFLRALRHSSHLPLAKRIMFLINLGLHYFSKATLALPPELQKPIAVPKNLYPLSYQFFCENPQGRREIAYFLSLIKPESIVFDIGGFCGAYSFAAKSINPMRIKVYCVEALQTNVLRINAVQALNPNLNIEVVNALVADTDLAGLQIVEADSMVRLGDAKGDNASSIVHSVSIDHLCDSWKVRPTILKIDVEGFEFHVLRSAKNLLATDGPMLFIELHPGYLSAQGVKTSEIVAYLSSFGYSERPFEDVDSPSAKISYHSLFVKNTPISC
jgi:FkbM family methyltransferase